ncbi:hypothetical protein BDZ91DRAFT_477168 [Kalaharituber pfeilii]|nr:hypothetical protein BDZ91DRAFT_477168 [Kalaharituber pfeilii]
MAGLYAHPSFVSSGAILTAPQNASSKEGENGSSSGGSKLTTTISNSSHISMQNNGSSSLTFGNGTPNFIPEPHPGTLVSILESPLGSPTGNRKTSVFSTSTSKSTPFRYVNGRRFHSDESIIYILPCDIPELNRQNLKHLLYKEVFGGYHMADFSDKNKIPRKVLDIGCGTGIWIASMHDEFAARGFDDVKFIGMDIVPVHAPMAGVDFTFVRHDALRMPYPFKDGEFDYVFIRDLTLGIPDTVVHHEVIAECMRVLREGGVFEIQCTDHSIRGLSPTKAPRNPSSAYTITPTLQFEAQPRNDHIKAYNARLQKVLGKRNLSPMPCTLMPSAIVMEGSLTNHHTLRMALPLDEAWWEFASYKDGDIPPTEKGELLSEIKRKNSVSAKIALHQSVLTEEQKAVRYMARLQLKQFIDSMEVYAPETRETPGEDCNKPYEKMTANFFQEGGLRGGECLEFGAWWGTKKNELTPFASRT